MAKGDVYRNMRLPQVARDVASGAAVVTLNGDEDQFVVLQMNEETAHDLARKLNAAGYGEADH
jgi:hypothetical protein